ncbi:MAG TPA: translation initiation factor IF-2 [Myxococcota bacterium]|nr:translation initiation factor IF-2 [Myxococcota bacterium]HOH77253.1 translation initiation factor IF-2 [Myxococcota bacterium]HPV04473.1 translation initiation factor IF-2 [Myxococcota bacterium]
MGRRVYEVAKELGVESADVLKKLRDSGEILKDHLAPLTREQEDRIRKLFAIQKEGEVQVKRMDGGRIVRRRAGAVAAPGQGEAPKPEDAAPAAPVPVSETAATEPVVAEVAAEQPVVAEGAVTGDVPEAKVEAAVVEPAVVDVVTPVSVEAPSQERAIDAASDVPPEAGVKTAAVRSGAPADARPETAAETAAREKEESQRKGKQKPRKDEDVPKASQVVDKDDAKAKGGKKLVFDRRRGVITLQDFSYGAEDESDHFEQRNQNRRKAPKPQRRGRAMKTQVTMPSQVKRNIKVECDEITVAELAHRMSQKATELVRKLMGLGIMASVNQAIDFETASLLANDFGFTVEKTGFCLDEQLREIEDNPEDLRPRPPVITVMGHVDHGKTTLLDQIRNADVADHEAGGITQHIGAYKVKTDGGDIVFLDTPGHEAFTAMRARGASATDIVILMVAADDGVMAQTKEAIAHARESGAPIIVAINKIDKPDANLDKTKQELAQEGLISEEWGGDTIICEISAKKNIGVDRLKEMILLQSEVMELKANPNKPARGVVLESQLDRALGPVATVLVQSGTLRVGDAVVSGMAHGRVRLMVDDKGRTLEEAGPATPVRVAGLDTVPDAGDVFAVVADEKKAREIADFQIETNRKARAAVGASRVSLEDLFNMVQSGDVKDLKVIVKADVQGSMAPLVDSVLKLKHPMITLKIIHQAVGNVAESDVNLAIAANAVIVGFNVNVDPKARSLADQEKVDIKRYSVIYDVIDDLKKAMEGLLAPKLVAKLIGKAEVRQVFAVSKVGKIAGSMVFEGVVNRNCTVHVMREGKKVFEGKLFSLKRFKDDAREVKSGLECGIGVDGFEDIAQGDILEFYEFEEVRETISSPNA